MNKLEIEKLVTESLLSLWQRDYLLFEYKVKEECINHRLALYFEILYPKIKHDDLFHSVDSEYNKNASNKNKTIIVEEIPMGIRPDIIIHKRGDNRDNLLACECKHGRLNKFDRVKLTSLLNDPFNYLFTIGISYFPGKLYFEYEIRHISKGRIIVEKRTFPKTGNNALILRDE